MVIQYFFYESLVQKRDPVYIREAFFVLYITIKARFCIVSCLVIYINNSYDRVVVTISSKINVANPIK